MSVSYENDKTMSNQDLHGAARRYLVANAVIGSAASKMAQLNREQAAKVAQITSFYANYKSAKELSDHIGRLMLCKRTGEAFTYLNTSLRNEMVRDCQNQKEFTTPLPELIESRKAKYRPFYERIGMEMPEDLDTMTAEDLCFVMSVKLMTPEELNDYHRRKADEEWAEKFMENLGLAFRAVLIIGLLILMAYLSAQ